MGDLMRFILLFSGGDDDGDGDDTPAYSNLVDYGLVDLMKI